MSTNYISKGAEISACGKYRYRLWREWRGTHDPNNWRWLRDAKGGIAKDGNNLDLGEPKACVFVMLNPSTADGSTDDPTIRRCVGFAKRWNFERLEVVNLFAFRATDPQTVLRMSHGPKSDDPVGVENSEHFERVMPRAGVVVCAWGNHGRHLDQDETALGWMLGYRAPIVALKISKDGNPCHPLYLPSNSARLPFMGRRT